jgi:hypothetical protein
MVDFFLLTWYCHVYITRYYAPGRGAKLTTRIVPANESDFADSSNGSTEEADLAGSYSPEVA